MVYISHENFKPWGCTQVFVQVHNCRASRQHFTCDSNSQLLLIIINCLNDCDIYAENSTIACAHCGLKVYAYYSVIFYTCSCTNREDSVLNAAVNAAVAMNIYLLAPE